MQFHKKMTSFGSHQIIGTIFHDKCADCGIGNYLWERGRRRSCADTTKVKKYRNE